MRVRVAEHRRALGFGLLTLVAAAIAGLTVVGGFGGGATSELQSDNGVRLRGVHATQRLLAGIPRNGTLLGQPNAPVTVHEYTDLKCPPCREHTVSRLQQLIDGSIRTGKANLRLHLVNIVDAGLGTSDGARALRAADNVASSDGFWPFVLMLFYNQGPEATEWATDMRLRDIASRTRGLAQARLNINETSVSRRVRQAEDRGAAKLGVQSAPSFFVQPRGTREYTAVDSRGVGIANAVLSAARRAEP